MEIQQIIIGIVIVLLIYLLYLWLFGDNTHVYLSGIHKASDPLVIDRSKFPNNKKSSDYTYSIWLYINNWDTSKRKDIFYRKSNKASKASKPAIHVSLGQFLNNVNVSLGLKSKSPKSQICTLENIPLQTWANVTITINNRSLDLYLNGKLVRTCILTAVPVMPSGYLHVCTAVNDNTNGNGFDGYISNFQYLARAINPREAYAIYKEGPGGSSWITNLINKYRIKIAFMNNNREVNSFEI